MFDILNPVFVIVVQYLKKYLFRCSIYLPVNIEVFIIVIYFSKQSCDIDKHTLNYDGIIAAQFGIPWLW